MHLLAVLLRKVFGGIVFGKAFAWLKRAWTSTFGTKAGEAAGKKVGGGVLGKLKGIFWGLLDTAGIMLALEEVFKRLIGWIGVGGAVVSGGANVSQVWHLLENIGDPQKAVLDWLGDALSQLPSISQLVAQADAVISNMTTWQYISPVPTLTNVLQITGVGFAFNQILMSMIQNMIFVFSIFVVRWGFSGNFTFTKSVNKHAKV